MLQLACTWLDGRLRLGTNAVIEHYLDALLRVSPSAAMSSIRALVWMIVLGFLPGRSGLHCKAAGFFGKGLDSHAHVQNQQSGPARRFLHDDAS